MAAAILGDSILEKILCGEIAEIVNKMSSPDKVPTYSEEESSDEEEWGENDEEWGEDDEVVIEEEDEEEDNSTVRRPSKYSLGYLDFSDHQEGRVENTLWYELMVKHNNIITEKRPPPPPPPPPQPKPRRLPPLVRYARYLDMSDDDEEEVEKLLCAWGWPPGAGQPAITAPTSHPALTV